MKMYLIILAIGVSVHSAKAGHDDVCTVHIMKDSGTYLGRLPADLRQPLYDYIVGSAVDEYLQERHSRTFLSFEEEEAFVLKLLDKLYLYPISDKDKSIDKLLKFLKNYSGEKVHFDNALIYLVRNNSKEKNETRFAKMKILKIFGADFESTISDAFEIGDLEALAYFKKLGFGELVDDFAKKIIEECRSNLELHFNEDISEIKKEWAEKILKMSG